MPRPKLLLLLLLPLYPMFCVPATLSQGRQSAAKPRPAGIAWRVQGDWRMDAQTTPLESGDAVLPGSLLMPITTTTPHSITLFLPDGQRILDECFTQEDCRRGFRIPALTERPSPFAVQLLRTMGTQLVENRLATGRLRNHAPSAQPHTTAARREEALVVLGADQRASITGALSALPNGEYHYKLVPLDPHQSTQFQLPLHKTSPACVIPVPAPGLYEVSIWDSENTPRFELFLAAIEPAQQQRFADYAKAKKLLADWDEEYYGWPSHDFLRAYLQALMRGAK